MQDVSPRILLQTSFFLSTRPPFNLASGLWDPLGPSPGAGASAGSDRSGFSSSPWAPSQGWLSSPGLCCPVRTWKGASPPHRPGMMHMGPQSLIDPVSLPDSLSGGPRSSLFLSEVECSFSQPVLPWLWVLLERIEAVWLSLTSPQPGLAGPAPRAARSPCSHPLPSLQASQFQGVCLGGSFTHLHCPRTKGTSVIYSCIHLFTHLYYSFI